MGFFGFEARGFQKQFRVEVVGLGSLRVRPRAGDLLDI